MEPTGIVECECDAIDRPVSSFGDFVCSSSTSSVRDIIRRFEVGEALESVNVPAIALNQSNPQKPSDKIVERRVVYEEQLMCPQRAAQTTVQEYFAKQSAIRSRDKICEKKAVFESSAPKINSLVKQQDSLPDKNPFVSRKEADICYPSKTTICKTDFGVRIIVDINFSRHGKLENWQGSRIETDLPSSEILTELQKKVD